MGETQKIQVLICMNKMLNAGTEVACLNLIKSFDFEQYAVTLLLYEKTGDLLAFVPEQVRIQEIEFDNARICRELHDGFFENRPMRFLTAKIIDLWIRLWDKLVPGINHRYKYLLKHVIYLSQKYDYILDFQGYGFFMSAFVASLSAPKKKLTWVHDENVEWADYIKGYLDCYDYYCAVSKACARSIIQKRPQYRDKTYVFYNLMDANLILKRAKEDPDIAIDGKSPCLVTVGRLEDQKGYPHAIQAAAILKEKDFNFQWYFIGTGSRREILEQMTREFGVEDYVHLLGAKSNPYPYIKNCTLYVQPSKHEGYGIAIAEARLLGKCLVATALDCIKEQIRDGENGYLVEYDAEKLAEKIQMLLVHPELRGNVEQRLREENTTTQWDKPTWFKYSSETN